MQPSPASSASTTRAPLPPGRFLLGHLIDYKRDMMGFLAARQAEQGDIFRIRLGRREIHMLCHPDMAEQVLIKERGSFGKVAELGGPPRGLPLVLGKGLVTNYGEAWQRQRQLIQPIFHKGQIARMADTMTAAGERLLTRWRDQFQPGAVVDIAQEMMRVTVDIVSETMFGEDVADKVDVIGESFPRLLRYAFASLTDPFTPPLHWPTPGNRAFLRARDQLDQLIYELIEHRLKGGEPRGDLLDMLLAARHEDSGEAMSFEQLRDEVATVFGAGHETTANALSWTWYLLAGHDAVRARLREELRTVLGGRTPTFADLPSLPYTRAVFEESMRLFPPAPVIPRAVMRDTHIGGYALHKGELTITNAFLIHQHPGFWREPAKFDPERFLPGAAGPAHRCAYIPFGAGPRVCIGNHFALMEGQLLLAQIAQRYDLKLVPGQKIEREVAVTMRPKYGMRMTLNPIQ